MIYDSAQITGALTRIYDIKQAHKKARELYSERFAPEFSTFFFIDTSELGLSRILAWFLDPCGSHGQGSRFLKQFLEVLGLETDSTDCDSATVKAEAVLGEAGRLDVHVKITSFDLVIENKSAGAIDQPRQLTRYFGHFDQTYVAKCIPPSKCVVVYLTKNGEDPSDISIGKEDMDRRKEVRQLFCWGYDREILIWLAKCKAECRADRVSIFIDEFSSLIRKQFKDEEDTTMSNHILSEITKSDVLLSATLQVASLADAIREKLFSELVEQIQSLIHDKNLKIYVDSEDKSPRISVKYSESSPYFIKLRLNPKTYNDLYIGVHRIEKKIGEIEMGEAGYSALKAKFGKGYNNDWWLWQHPVSLNSSLLPITGSWENQAEPWLEIQNKKLASRVVDAFVKIEEVMMQEGLI